tara:strand:- start:1247 stop:1363 length:117 start_codon:yes stop_codon:yes gene_type:complete
MLASTDVDKPEIENMEEESGKVIQEAGGARPSGSRRSV